MNTPYFIAKRLIRERKGETSFSRPINIIAITGIALGMAVMILAISILTGFKQEVRDKVAGFGSHIQILNFDSNISYETEPIRSDQDFIPDIAGLDGIKHIQVFATKAGIIQANENIEGVILKGIGPDFDWSFFKSNMEEGDVFVVSDTARTDKVVVSRKLCDLLNLKIGDSFNMYFQQDPPRQRKFTISGIYETSLEEFDRVFVFCDINHIRRLNGWDDNQVSGFEILISDFGDLDNLTWEVRDKIGFTVAEDEERLKVSNVQLRYPQIFDWLNFQDLNVIIIIVLMLLVAGFNMISGLLILILEKTNMIGVLKAVGAGDGMISKAFLYQAVWLTGKGLFWGNLIGIGLSLIQLKTGLISLDPTSYYLKTVPVNLDPVHLLLLNGGAMLAIVLMLLIPARLIGRITPVKAIRYE
jgi:lipoprotein-releasing system permease protein